MTTDVTLHYHVFKEGNRMIKNEWIDASILFSDIVGFSKQNELRQKEIYEYLWKTVKDGLRSCDEYSDYILKSTGDGILLITLNPRIDPLKIAKNLQQKLRGKDIYIRQGLNCGKVLPVNDRRDSIGDPINICQRIMDCGDANHILASDHYVLVKIGSRPPREFFSDFGEVIIKHNDRLRIFNYYDKEYGNANFPKNLFLLFPKIRTFCIEGSWDDLLECCEIIDLSHKLHSKPSCSYTSSILNEITAEQTKGQAIGVTFITTKLGNVFMNYGTHIDFPGHLLSHGIKSIKNVGEYTLDNFVCEAIVVDIRDKLKSINSLVNTKENIINVEQLGQGQQVIKEFLSIIESMEITLHDFLERIGKQDIAKKAILFCTNLDKYWDYGQFEPWRYSYFFNPYISIELAHFLAKEKVSLVGIDALQIENPIINLGGKELFPILSKKYNKLIKRKLESISQNFIHQILLENDVLLVENLKNLTKIIGRKVLFIAAPLGLDIPGCTDNSITRAFALAFKPRKI